MSVKACKMFGYLCTPVLGTESMAMCGDVVTGTGSNAEYAYGDIQCPEPGYYTFYHSFTFGKKSDWTEFALNGMSFNLYATLHDESMEDYNKIVCHAQFTTWDYDDFAKDYYGKNNQYPTSYTASAVGAIALLGLGAYGFQTRRRRLEESSSSYNDDIVDHHQQLQQPALIMRSLPGRDDEEIAVDFQAIQDDDVVEVTGPPMHHHHDEPVANFSTTPTSEEVLTGFRIMYTPSAQEFVRI